MDNFDTTEPLSPDEMRAFLGGDASRYMMSRLERRGLIRWSIFDGAWVPTDAGRELRKSMTPARRNAGGVGG